MMVWISVFNAEVVSGMVALMRRHEGQCHKFSCEEEWSELSRLPLLSCGVGWSSFSSCGVVELQAQSAAEAIGRDVVRAVGSQASRLQPGAESRARPEQRKEGRGEGMVIRPMVLAASEQLWHLGGPRVGRAGSEEPSRDEHCIGHTA